MIFFKILSVFFLTVFVSSCGEHSDFVSGLDVTEINSSSIDSTKNTIKSRFIVPKGFERVKADSSTYSFYLRNLPLKKPGSEVKLFNGNSKGNQTAHISVIDLPIGKKDLHQCADAVMRLRAEYLWKTKQYEKIHYNLTNGFRVDYSKWMKGNRVIVEGNKTYWKLTAAASNSYSDFWKYMEFIFTYAGTLSLSKELKSIELKEISVGDVFIRGGSPGHAVIVVDVAVNPKTNEKVFMLAQSYMPAQEIQVLKNPIDDLSPWYSTDFVGSLQTPEWTFKSSELKRFED